MSDEDEDEADELGGVGDVRLMLDVFDDPPLLFGFVFVELGVVEFDWLFDVAVVDDDDDVVRSVFGLSVSFVTIARRFDRPTLFVIRHLEKQSKFCFYSVLFTIFRVIILTINLPKWTPNTFAFYITIIKLCYVNTNLVFGIYLNPILIN